MKPLKAIIKSPPKVLDANSSYPIPEIDQARWTALNNVILQARLACDQPIPDPEFVDVLIISWNQALRRIPTDQLQPALQYAIENHRGLGKITCSAIYQAYRELLRNRISSPPKLNAPYTTPPPEYYEILARLKIFPEVKNEANTKPKPKKQRPEYRIEKKTGTCNRCSTQVNLLVSYQQQWLCLDCASQQIPLAK